MMMRMELRLARMNDLPIVKPRSARVVSATPEFLQPESQPAASDGMRLLLRRRSPVPCANIRPPIRGFPVFPSAPFRVSVLAAAVLLVPFSTSFAQTAEDQVHLKPDDTIKPPPPQQPKAELPEGSSDKDLVSYGKTIRVN